MLGPNPQIAGPRPWTSGFFNPCPLRVIAEETFSENHIFYMNIEEINACLKQFCTGIFSIELLIHFY
jgi:hypothetical protein